MGEGHRTDFHAGGEEDRVLGDDHFVERVLAQGAASVSSDLTLADVEGKVLEIYRLDPAELARRGRRRKPAEARAVIAALAVPWDVSSLTEVARRYHCDVATLSEAVRRAACNCE
jgi:chromosomal replication initiation ATPase DnaA